MSEWIITDELLARYIDGLTTAEEDARIEAALAENPLLMEEFVQMAEAARMSDATPVKKPDLNKALTGVQEAIQVNSTSKHRNLRIRYVAVAGAVAAVLLLVLLVVKPFQKSLVFVAQNNTNTVETDASVEPYAEVKSPTTANHSQSDNTIENKTEVNTADAPSAFAEAQLSEAFANEETTGEVITVHKIEKNTTSASEANHLSMEKPAKASYRLLCKNLDKNYTFQWKVSNVKTLSFFLKTKQGKTIAELDDAQTECFAVSYRKLYPENQFIWCVSVVYNDGKCEQRSGVLQIDYDVQ